MSPENFFETEDENSSLENDSKEKKVSPEEMAKIKKERTLSDAELIKGGAEYVGDENGIRLNVTESQIKEASNEMQAENEKIYREKVMHERINNIKQGNFTEIEQQMEYVRENVDYQSMSKDEFLQFENSFATFQTEIMQALYNFFNVRNGMHVTVEEFNKWLNEKR